MVHEVAYTKAVQGLAERGAPKPPSVRKDKLELKRGQYGTHLHAVCSLIGSL